MTMMMTLTMMTMICHFYTEKLQINARNKIWLYGIKRCSYSVFVIHGTFHAIPDDKRFVLLH
jgi:hypothetical protein